MPEAIARNSYADLVCLPGLGKPVLITVVSGVDGLAVSFLGGDGDLAWLGLLGYWDAQG